MAEFTRFEGFEDINESDEYEDIEESKDYEEGEEQDDGTYEMMRLLQLQDTLYEMKLESLQTVFEDRLAIRFFMTVGGEETSLYFRYCLVDIDKGNFILEAVMPMSVQNDKNKAALFCMDYNRTSAASSLYWTEGRYYLRLIQKEYGMPADEEMINNLLKEVKLQRRVFILMNQ